MGKSKKNDNDYRFCTTGADPTLTSAAIRSDSITSFTFNPERNDDMKS
jgi:hypothetical protein